MRVRFYGSFWGCGDYPYKPFYSVNRDHSTIFIVHIRRRIQVLRGQSPGPPVVFPVFIVIVLGPRLLKELSLGVTLECIPAERWTGRCRTAEQDASSRWPHTSVADHPFLHLLRPRLSGRPIRILSKLHSSLPGSPQRPMRDPPSLPPRPMDVYRRMQVPVHAVPHR